MTESLCVFVRGLSFFCSASRPVRPGKTCRGRHRPPVGPAAARRSPALAPPSRAARAPKSPGGPADLRPLLGGEAVDDTALVAARCHGSSGGEVGRLMCKRAADMRVRQSCVPRSRARTAVVRAAATHARVCKTAHRQGRLKRTRPPWPKAGTRAPAAPGPSLPGRLGWSDPGGTAGRNPPPLARPAVQHVRGRGRVADRPPGPVGEPPPGAPAVGEAGADPRMHVLLPAPGHVVAALPSRGLRGRDARHEGVDGARRRDGRSGPPRSTRGSSPAPRQQVR